MLDLKMEVTGDFDAMLDKLEEKIQTKVLFSGAAAAAKVFYEEVQHQVLYSRSPKNPKPSTGTLYSAIYRAYSPEESTPTKIVYHISVNKKKFGYWYLVEYGSSRAPAWPYIRPAFDKAGVAMQAGIDRMMEVMGES